MKSPSSPSSSPVPESGMTRNRECRHSAIHEPVVLEYKRALFSIQHTGNPAQSPHQPADPAVSVIALSIWPWLVATRSPLNCLSMDMRPSFHSGSAPSNGKGRRWTSKAPFGNLSHRDSFLNIAVIPTTCSQPEDNQFVTMPLESRHVEIRILHVVSVEGEFAVLDGPSGIVVTDFASRIPVSAQPCSTVIKLS